MQVCQLCVPDLQTQYGFIVLPEFMIFLIQVFRDHHHLIFTIIFEAELVVMG